MAAPMRSTDFRSIVEPILNECFDGVYDQRADEWSRVFREQDGIPRNYHEEPVLYGFGLAPLLPDGSPVTYQQGGVLFLRRNQQGRQQTAQPKAPTGYEFQSVHHLRTIRSVITVCPSDL